MIKESGRGILTFTMSWQPDVFLAESVSISVEAVELAFLSVHEGGIHRGVLLMAKDNARARLACSARLAALAADRLLLVAFEFAFATCHAIESHVSHRAKQFRELHD